MVDFRSLCAVVIFCTGLTSCMMGPSPAAVAFDKARADEKAADDARFVPYSGQSYWVTRAFRLGVCDDRELRKNCQIRWGHFHIDSFYNVTGRYGRFQVTFDNAPPGYSITTLDFIAAHFLTSEPPFQSNIQPTFLKYLPKKVAAERLKKSGVLLGMSEEEVLESSWGKPDDVKLTIKGGYRDKTIWYYPHDNRLHFSEGYLVKIEE